MKSLYVIPLLISVLGIGLLVAGATSDANMSVLGMALSSLLVKRIGLIVFIMSGIGFLAVYGSTLPPLRSERRSKPDHDREGPGKVETLAGHRNISRSA